MTLLSKDQILGADDLPPEDVEVPEWGGKVRVRGLSSTERDRFEMEMALARKNGTTPEFRSTYAGRCMVDDKGERLFTDAELTKLGRKSGAALDRIFDVVRELSGMTDQKLKQAAADFENAPSDASPSA